LLAAAAAGDVQAHERRSAIGAALAASLRSIRREKWNMHRLLT
jgi:hypothetical protein